MYNDGTMKCGVEGCHCKKYNEGKDEKSFQERRCVCGHTKVNHIFNTRDHLFDKGEDEK